MTVLSAAAAHMPRRWLARTTPGRVLTTVVLTPVTLVWIYPFLWMVSAAFKTNTEIFAGPGLIPSSLNWDNFNRAWYTANVARNFVNSLIISASAVLIVLITTSMMGYALGRYRFRGRVLIIAAFTATVFIPEGYTIIPIFRLVTALHLNNTLLGVILAEAGNAHVLFILLFAGYFSQLPGELEESAVIDGAGFFRVFWTIMLPLAGPVLATATLLQFMASWNSFFLPLVLTLSKPSLQPLAVGMYSFQGEYFSDWSGMAAAATISQVPIILLFLFLQRYFVEGIAGAVKQ